jgi:hypothetical protein
MFSEISFLLILLSVVSILGAIFYNKINQALGLKRMAEGFQNPRLRRSAEARETIGRLSMVILGVNFGLMAIGPKLVPLEVVKTIQWALIVFLFLLFFLMIGITVINWRS